MVKKSRYMEKILKKYALYMKDYFLDLEFLEAYLIQKEPYNKYDPNIHNYLKEVIKLGDPRVLRIIVKHFPKYDKKYRNDIYMVSSLMDHGLLYKHVGVDLKNDKTIVRKYIQKGYLIYDSIMESLKMDEDIIMDILNLNIKNYKFIVNNIPESMYLDPNFFTKIVSHNDNIEYIPARVLNKNRKWILEMAKRNHSYFKVTGKILGFDKSYINFVHYYLNEIYKLDIKLEDNFIFSDIIIKCK